MTAVDPSRLAASARAVLARNDRGTWTVPSTTLYPHQWLWDSCFVAIGLATIDPGRAATELRSLLRGQWSNGMVPHMVFAPGVDDLGSRRLWRSQRDPRAPRDVDTSCITQPPVLAIAVHAVAARLAGAERDAFLADVVPRVLAYHGWLYRERDPARTGLVTLVHPWECGLDTTPPWMAALAGAPQPWWLRAALRLRVARLVRWFRRDTRYVPAAERSSDDDGLRMLALARSLGRAGYDLARLPPGALRVEDVAFNALLIVANRRLAELAGAAGVPVDDDLTAAMASAPVRFEELWSDADAAYCARDATSGAPLGPPTIASFFALWAGVRPDRQRTLVSQLRESRWNPAHPVPSVAVDAPVFDARRYWKGPTWINTNWIVVEGLRAAGESQLADRLRDASLALVAEHGFAEYFSPFDGEPLGADEFSWSAALTLALL